MVTRSGLLGLAVLLAALSPLTAAHGAARDARPPSPMGTPDPASSDGSAGTAEGFLPSGCEQSLTATLDNHEPVLGEIITFAVTVSNNSPDPAPLDLWIHASGQHFNFVHKLAAGTLAGNATVTRNVRVRVPEPWWVAGLWAVKLHIGTFSFDICDTESFDVVVSSSLTAGGTGTAFESLVPEDDFFASVSGSTVAVMPNPFVSRTTIRYAIEEAADVRLTVYDALGREVAVLVDGRQEAGAHSAVFDASGLAAGTYVYRLTVGSEVQTGRLTLAH
jgi:hypothetical protein